MDDRGRPVLRLRGGESCHGCGARVGARFVACETREEATGECRPTIAVFRPHRVWKGEPLKELTLHPGASCLGCDVLGHRSLVYAERGPEGRLHFVRTRAVEGGAAELAWLGEPRHASVQDPLMDSPLAPLVLLVRLVLQGWGGHGGLLQE